MRVKHLKWRDMTYKDSSSLQLRNGKSFREWKRGNTRPATSTRLHWEVVFETIELLEDLPQHTVVAHFPYEKRKLAKQAYDDYYTRLTYNGKTIVRAFIRLVSF